MAYNGSGTFTLVAGNPVVSGTVISATTHNNTMSDIANNGLSNAITKDGQTTITQNIPFNSKRITGLGEATARTDAARVDQVQNSFFISLTTVAGTDTITATLSPTPSAYAEGQVFIFEPANDNTGPATINISSLGAKDIYFNSSPLVGGEIVAGEAVIIRYNGTEFDLLTASSKTYISGRKNYIINGNFDIWQRGTSFEQAGYTADRWFSVEGGGDSVVTRQAFTLGQTDVPNEPKYFFRHTKNTAGTASHEIATQRIEGVRTLAGQTVTVSFWAKTSNAQTLVVQLQQNFGTGGTPSASVELSQNINVTTSWQKFALTFNLASLSGKTIGTDNNDYLAVRVIDASPFSVYTFDLAQVQLEKGSVVTDFEYRTESEELFLCEKYCQRAPFYFRFDDAGSTGVAYSSPVAIRPQMRDTPSVLTVAVGEGIGVTNTSSVVQDRRTAAVVFQLSATGPITRTYWGNLLLDAEL